jgi:hypothetical protein
LKSIGRDPHVLKKPYNVGSKQDVYKDCKGNLYLGNKDRTGEIEDLGENIDDLRRQQQRQ